MLENLPGTAMISTPARGGWRACALRGVEIMEGELQTKVEKYEQRAARCEEQARAATEKSQQNFYEVLANYYRSLATDFRQIIEKRKSA